MLFPLWPFSVRAPSVATVLRQRTWPRPQTTGAKRSLSMLGECGRLSAAQCPSIVHSVLGGRDPVLGHTASTVARHHSGRRWLTPARHVQRHPSAAKSRRTIGWRELDNRRISPLLWTTVLNTLPIHCTLCVVKPFSVLLLVFLTSHIFSCFLNIKFYKTTSIQHLAHNNRYRDTGKCNKISSFKLYQPFCFQETFTAIMFKIISTVRFGSLILL